MSHVFMSMFRLLIPPAPEPNMFSHPSENTDVPCPIWRPNVNLFASVFHHHQSPGLGLALAPGNHPSWVWVPLSRTVDWHSVGPWSERTTGSDSPSRAGRARAWACGTGARWASNARCRWHLSSRLLRTLESAGGCRSWRLQTLRQWANQHV